MRWRAGQAAVPATTFGCWLDTLGDYVYYLALFAGLTAGAVRRSGDPAYWWLGGGLLAGAFLTFWLLILLRQRATGGQPEALHATTKAHFTAGNAWQRLLARVSFVATRAAMPYGVVAFALAGALPVLLVLATVGAHVYWISLALELRRLLPDAPAANPAAGAAPLPSV